jgi:hypothetical protein
MTPRIAQEFELIKKFFPNVEYKEGGWIRLPVFKIMSGSWSKNSEDICFQAPNGYPGQPPYGFYVKGGMQLKNNNQKIGNYTETKETPFGGIWGKFSWQVDGVWQPTADVKSGSNLLSFIRSFNDRLMEGH